MPPDAGNNGPAAAERHSTQDLSDTEVQLLGSWITHAHEEIHRYLRQRQTILQIVVVAASAALAAIGQRGDLAQPLIVIAPYVLSAAVINWLNCGAEVSISGAVADEMEEMLKDARGGRWLLFQETAANGLKPNGFGGKIGDYTPMLFVLGSYVASGIVGWRWTWLGWHPQWCRWLNISALALFLVLVYVHSKSVKGMRDRMRAHIKTLRGGGQSGSPTPPP
jgi:hypothetical protein